MQKNKCSGGVWRVKAEVVVWLMCMNPGSRYKDSFQSGDLQMSRKECQHCFLPLGCAHEHSIRPCQSYKHDALRQAQHKFPQSQVCLVAQAGKACPPCSKLLFPIPPKQECPVLQVPHVGECGVSAKIQNCYKLAVRRLTSLNKMQPKQ